MRIRWAKKAIRPKADALERQILRLFKNRQPRHRRFAKIAAILALGSRMAVGRDLEWSWTSPLVACFA